MSTNGDQLCEWFFMCPNESDGVIEHPTLGDVPICLDCYRKGQVVGFSSTFFIPPIAARTLRGKLCVDCQRPFQGPGTGCPDCQALALSILRRGQGVSC